MANIDEYSRKHAEIAHKCACGKTIRGNAYYAHTVCCAEYAKSSQQFELSQPERTLLCRLGDVDGWASTRQVGQQLVLPAVTLKRLVDRGFVERRRSDGLRGSYRYRITQAGRGVLACLRT